jgi:hypothetical protein
LTVMKSSILSEDEKGPLNVPVKMGRKRIFKFTQQVYTKIVKITFDCNKKNV